MLSNQDIRKFQALYKKHLNIALNDKDAYEKAMKLIRFVDVVTHILDEDQNDEDEAVLDNIDGR